MRAELTKIGNSRGVRIPKPLIEQCGLGNEVEFHVTPQGLMITPRHRPRHGWKEAFAKATAAHEGLLLDRLPASSFDREEWKW